jgi:uncharacterized membrane protein YdbT with pleckstrin-like domain
MGWQSVYKKVSPIFLMPEYVFYEGAPSPRILAEWAFTRLVPHTIVIGLIWTLIVATVYIADAGVRSFLPILLFGFICIGILISIYLIFLMTSYQYRITDSGVYFSGGIPVRREEFMPFREMSSITASQDSLELVLGIGNLIIRGATTEGYSGREIVFEGLANPEEPLNILETYRWETSYHRYYTKPMKALRELKEEKKKALAMEESPKTSRYSEAENNQAVSRGDALQELFKKWKNGEITAREYLQKKEELKRYFR